MAKDSTGILLLLGGAGVAYWGYTQGWFASFGLTPAGTAAAPATNPTPNATITAAQAAAVLAAAQAAAAAASASAPPPALGTTVTSATDVLKQIGAQDPFVIPDAATAAAIGAPPSNYGAVTTTDKGVVFLRPDVYSAVQNLISGRLAKIAAANAAGTPVAATSIQNATNVTLADIQSTMSLQGLSGLGAWELNRHLATRGYYA